MLYILKIKGTDTIPDFVQIRDKNMILRAYFRLSQANKGLIKNNLTKEKNDILNILGEIPFGKIHKYIKNV